MSKANRKNHMSDQLFVITRGGESQPLFPHAASASAGRFIFLSGQLALDKDGKTVGKGDMRAQLRQVGENLKAALEEAGASLDDIIKTNTYVTDMQAFFDCMDVRREYFGEAFPTSTTVEVSRLADPDMLIEIEAIAVVDDN